jgi:hypothetical protein
MRALLFVAILSLGMSVQVLFGNEWARAQNPTDNVTDLPLSSLRYAILVGVEKYDDVNIPSLIGPVNDVNKMRKSLETYAGFVEDNIFVLSTAGPPPNAPTRTQILIALSKIKNSVPTNGLLLFMFSGHGISRGNSAYLLPSDARQTDDPELLTETALPVDLIRQRIADTGVKQAIVFLDACRNDLESSKGEGENRLTRAFMNQLDFASLNNEIEASAVVYATALGSRAWIDNSKHLGYFTEAITDGLSGKAEHNQGQITLNNLLVYVQSAVPKMVARDLGPTKVQKPFFVLSGYKPSELVIAKSDALVPSTSRTGTAPEASSAEVPDLHKAIPASTTNLDFGSLFGQYENDELALSHLGEAAFLRANYEWTIKSLERAKAVQRSGVWMSSYPYLAAAYLLGQNDEVRFRSTLEDMVNAMQVPNTYLNHPIPISFVMANLTKVRTLVPRADTSFVDVAIDRATMVAGSRAAQDRTPVASVCTFYGEANPGAQSYQKKESCIIPDVNRLDAQYRQSNFNCCGGGATSPATLADIPPGLEIKVSGGHYWAVEGPTLASDKFSIVTYCGPGALGSVGCNVKTEVLAHYRMY